MSLKIGTKTISSPQRSLLEEAKASSDPTEVSTLLFQVVSDSDLTSGRENLHPEWLTLYQKLKKSSTASLHVKDLDKALEPLFNYNDLFSKINPAKATVSDAHSYKEA